jgi:exopolysaccharide biosynthesis polyprenyl glycosylphosphotransferase
MAAAHPTTSARSTSETQAAGASETHEAGASFSARQLRVRLQFADAAAVLLGFLLAFVWQELVRPVNGDIRLGHLALALVAVPVWIVALHLTKMYVARAVERPSEELRRIVTASAVGLASIVLLAFVVQYSMLSRLWVMSVFAFVTGTLVVERRIARRVFARLRAEGRIARRVMIAGTDAHAIGLMHTLQRNPALGYEVVGFLGDDDIGVRGGRTVLGPLDDAEQLLASYDCVGVLVSLASVGPDEVNRITRRLTDGGYHVALSSSLRDIDVTRIRPQTIDGQTLMYVEPTIRDGWRANAKRCFDVVVAALALAIAAPFLAIACVLIKLESPGPALFLQDRVGKGGRTFRIIKLRTMFQDAEARKAELLALSEVDGPLFKMKRDPRVTRVGRVLRKLSIDEFPQFWNVLRGEMSVVGPRPALPDEVARWDRDVHERLRVLPGITGMWQVSGRSDSTFDEYKRLDLYYVDNWSLNHDLKIVAKTFSAVVLQRGAS